MVADQSDQDSQRRLVGASSTDSPYCLELLLALPPDNACLVCFKLFENCIPLHERGVTKTLSPKLRIVASKS